MITTNPTSRQAGRRLVMNYSIYSADRSTHLKIVVMALVAGIAVAGFGISARTFSDDGSTQTARVIKAGKPVVVTSSNTSMSMVR
jgi:L-asparaginase/Glu-tRNA(Gln) amidotransferase subunit D